MKFLIKIGVTVPIFGMFLPLCLRINLPVVVMGGFVTSLYCDISRHAKCLYIFENVSENVL